jgi:hypothetical protein
MVAPSTAPAFLSPPPVGQAVGAPSPVSGAVSADQQREIDAQLEEAAVRKE